jgi:hypothetical protein
MTTSNKTPFHYKLLIGIAMFILIATLFSCSTRKVQLEKVKETTEIGQVNKDKTEVITNEVVKESTDTNNDVVTETTEIVPIDTTKESFFITPEGKKVQLNNAMYKRITTIDKSKSMRTIKKENKAVKRTQNDNLLRINKDVLHKTKETERITYWWFLLLLLIPIYFIYKNLNPST